VSPCGAGGAALRSAQRRALYDQAVKFLPLLLANLKRKKIRTTLTVGSFVVAFFLFGLLGSIHYGFRQGIDLAGADRLVVIGRTSIIQPLPLPYMDRLKRIPGVKDVAHATWFGGVYQDPKNFFAQFVIQPEDWLRMYPEFEVPPDQWQAFLADRQGTVIGRELAERFGWKLGDRIPLKTPGYLGGDSWDFNVRAIYTGTRPNDDETQMWLRHDYFYEKAPAFWKGIVGWYVVRVNNPDQAMAVSKAIDQEFSNSASETRTQTESEFVTGMVKQMGNIEFLILAIGSVVFFTLLLVTGNTMAIAVRERTNELATLKAIGFTNRFVLGLVLAEALLVAALGGVIGLGIAHLIAGPELTQGLILLYLPLSAMAMGLGIALGTGFLAGVIPAWNAMRLNVATALRRL
jgi:putative ABC transport system permease protein